MRYVLDAYHNGQWEFVATIDAGSRRDAIKRFQEFYPSTFTETWRVRKLV